VSRARGARRARRESSQTKSQLVTTKAAAIRKAFKMVRPPTEFIDVEKWVGITVGELAGG